MCFGVAAGVSPRPSLYFIVVTLILNFLFAFSPSLTSAETLWQSTQTHEISIPVYTPDQTYPWFGTQSSPSIDLGVWNGNDFTTTASTTLTLWARWNGVSSNILDVIFRTANSNPFDGSATSTAYVVGDPGIYGIVPVDSTTTLARYTIPVRVGETIHQGDHIGAFLYPSYSGYGANHWLGASGTVPYLELCDGDCEATSTPSAPVCTHDCYDSVLFLPGIEGSRLYEGMGCGGTTEEKLWEPVDSISDIIAGEGDVRVQKLSLNTSGTSICSDIYVKKGDILNTTLSGNLYKSFTDNLTSLKVSGAIKDWKAASYDWRLSLDALVNQGAEHDGRIYSGEATTTPYIEQTLRALAAASKTGKVTIVAHSNGGLVAKALLNRLGPSAATLVDRVILVGVPQSGTPADIASLLVGYNAGIYANVGVAQNVVPVVSNQAARAFALNAPMAYHLLPSEYYLESTLTDTNHPVVRFSGSAYAKEEAAYGSTIGNIATLDNFLLAREGGRAAPLATDLHSLQILNPTLIAYANTTHSMLDAWVPPTDIEVDQIAGWGIPTVQGIDLYSQPNPLQEEKKYRPIFVEDGDGTVTTASALMLGSGANVKSYWIDLNTLNKDLVSHYRHPNILEAEPAIGFIDNILTDRVRSSPYILTSHPPSVSSADTLTFFLHSPLTLQVSDAASRTTGLASDGTVSESIAGSSYGQFGEVKYVTVPSGAVYKLTMHGQNVGIFSLDIQAAQGNTITASTTLANMPTTASTTVTMQVPANTSTFAPLVIDENGDGIPDASVTPTVGATTLFDTTPPEGVVGFDTNIKQIQITGIDDKLGTTVVNTATSSTITDAVGNWITLGTKKSVQSNYSVLTLSSLAYSTGTTTSPSATMRYFWLTDKKGQYTLFITAINAPRERLLSVYVPLLKKTYILQSIAGDDSSDLSTMTAQLLLRKILKTASGMVVPYIKTQAGNIVISY